MAEKSTFVRLYRFQGGNTYPAYDLVSDSFRLQSYRYYTYFSVSIDHHRYFVYKRIKQYLNQKMLIEKKGTFNAKRLGDLNEYRKIRRYMSSCEIDLFNSLGLSVVGEFTSLIKDNYVYNSNKDIERSIERVDRRIYGGGYGFCDEWLELLNIMTLEYQNRRISRNDLLCMIKNIHNHNGSIIDCLNFLNNCDREIVVNSFIFDPFMKYRIMELLEEIIVSKKCAVDSKLSTNSRDVIRQVVRSYVDSQEFMMQKIEDYDRDGINFKLTL